MRVVAVDQGTTSTRSFCLDDAGSLQPCFHQEHRQFYPNPGWVEQDANELLDHVKRAVRAAGVVDAIGIANQGETVVAWDVRTGDPIYRALVWQDIRCKDALERIKVEGGEALTLRIAGLPLDPYFSAGKLRWLLDHAPSARTLLRQGRLRLGTSDAFFLYRLTGHFVTDVSTASRTSLMSMDDSCWSESLCRLFGVPMECLPAIVPSVDDFGRAGGIPVVASIVDQQAALHGHGCTRPGDAKITFGTGAFALALMPGKPSKLAAGALLPTVAWQIGNAPCAYAVDGAVFNAASAVNWARRLGLFRDFSEIDRFDKPPAIARDLAFVPALSGLACPHWDRSAAGLWIGLGLHTTPADLLQSLLEGVALRAAEVMAAMERQVPLRDAVSIDGGMAKNPYFAQFLSNVLGRAVRVPAQTELTALGAAKLCMLGAGQADAAGAAPPHQALYVPSDGMAQAYRTRFGDAIGRAKSWH